MEETLYIPKTRTLPLSQDYQFLREKGLAYIENLSHTLWTDYNTHDPGITILEALCYAITELGYRTGFDIKDLMAGPDGRIEANQAFFTARKIFTCNPVSVEDYCKLLVDLLGVHNAWLFPKANVGELPDDEIPPKTEVLVYPHCQKDTLVYDPTEHAAIDIRGLYEVMLDLDYSDEYGDLNSGNIVYTLSEAEVFGEQIEAILPRWNKADLELLEMIHNQPVQTVAVEKKESWWKVNLTYVINTEEKTFSYYVIYPLRKSKKHLEIKIGNQIKENPFIRRYWQLITGK